MGGASAVNGLVRLGRTRNANSMASCSFGRAPTGCWAQTSTGPQLTEVLRFVRAGDMVTVHPRAGGRRRTTGLVPVRHHSVDAGVDGGGRGPWVSEKQAGTAHAAVLCRESRRQSWRGLRR